MSGSLYVIRCACLPWKHPPHTGGGEPSEGRYSVYDVRVIEETDLPAAQGWAMVQTSSGSTTLLVKRSAICAETMAEAWAAARKLRRRRKASAAAQPVLQLVQ